MVTPLRSVMIDLQSLTNQFIINSRNNLKKAVKLKADKNIKKQRKKLIYTCDICQKKFNYKERFDAHKLEHEGKIVSTWYLYKVASIFYSIYI